MIEGLTTRGFRKKVRKPKHKTSDPALVRHNSGRPQKLMAPLENPTGDPKSASKAVRMGEHRERKEKHADGERSDHAVGKDKLNIPGGKDSNLAKANTKSSPPPLERSLTLKKGQVMIPDTQVLPK